MMTLTENAANEIKRQLAEAGSAEVSVRIGLERGRGLFRNEIRDHAGGGPAAG